MENHHAMKSGKRRRKSKNRRKIAYGVIVIALVLIFLIYLSLNQSNPTSHPKAAIVDHLSRRDPNQTFVIDSRTILQEAGFTVDYHGWTRLTDVNNYKNLFKQNYQLFVLRVHSAITSIDGEEVIGLFTWEQYDPENIPEKYHQDIKDDRLVEAYFTEEERAKGETYYGITHKFVEEYGEFQNAVIIMMGCNGLTYTSMAEAFVKKGAKAYISWDERVGISHTDQATMHLLQSLILDELTIKQAVTETMETVGPDWVYNNSTLHYYPKTPEAEDYTILSTKTSLIMNSILSSTTFKSLTKKPNLKN